jgi:hypothetical protein
LANALSALYPKESEEKRLLDAMLLAAVLTEQIAEARADRIVLLVALDARGLRLREKLFVDSSRHGLN